MSYSMNSVGSPNFRANDVYVDPEKRKSGGSSVLKGALIGAGITGALTGGGAMIANKTNKKLDEFRNLSSFTERRNALKDNNLVNLERRDICYSKGIRQLIENLKRPTNWAIMLGIGAAIGSIFGLLVKDKS